MTGSDSFTILMDRLRSGDDAAAAQVFNRFACHILDLARKQLYGSMRRKVDPEDVLQSVLRSFFVRHRDGQFDIANWDNLWGILMVMTLRKCSRHVQFFQAERRDVRREVGLGTEPSPAAHAGLIARDPTPSEAVVLIELLEGLMASLTPADRAILTLHLQGHTAAEIGAHVGRSLRTVRRVLDRIRHGLENARSCKPCDSASSVATS